MIDNSLRGLSFALATFQVHRRLSFLLLVGLSISLVAADLRAQSCGEDSLQLRQGLEWHYDGASLKRPRNADGLSGSFDLAYDYTSPGSRDTITWSARSTKPWIRVAPSGATTNQIHLSITVNPDNLPVGSHEGTVCVTGNFAIVYTRFSEYNTYTSILFHIRLLVTTTLSINVEPSVAFGTFLAGVDVDETKFVQVRSSLKMAPIDISTTPSNNSSREALDVGLAEARGSFFLPIRFHGKQLSPDIYQIKIEACTPWGPGSIISVAKEQCITVWANANVYKIDLVPDVLSFGPDFERGNMASKTIEVDISPSAYSDMWPVFGDQPDWLSTGSWDEKDIGSQRQGRITVTVDSTGLLPGEYESSISIVASLGPFTENRRISLMIPVHLRIDEGYPRISAIVGSGFSSPPVEKLSPNGLFTIFGVELAEKYRTLAPDDIQGRLVPSSLDGVCVTLDGEPIPLIFVSPGQINAQAPSVFDREQVALRIIRNCHGDPEIRGPEYVLSTSERSPEFLYVTTESGGTLPSVAAIRNDTGELVGCGSINGSQLPMLRESELATIFMVGLGLTDPLQRAGVVVDEVAVVDGFGESGTEIVIGGRRLDDSDIYYVGATPGAIGLYQATFRIGAYLRPGFQSIYLRVKSDRTRGGCLAIE